ncbi:hypothetical protein PIB30_014021 [Stylosanthes scabra]|uniref:Transferring glycosyl group transferase n=1 Tax=Stylosanthes scabra TaxID=79078 RepID=A0ABU6Y8E8_9FABA|nr:hypothetical protein [Stylosanthes scabra]
MKQHLMVIQKSNNKNKSQSLRNLILCLLTSLCATYYILVSTQLLATPKQILQHLNNHHKLSSLSQEHHYPIPTTIDHVVFGIASSGDSWPKRKQYTKLWWNNTTMKGCVFVDKMPIQNDNDSSSLPPLCVSEDTSRFKYTYRGPGGLRSAIRGARVVKETVALNHSGVRWYVFGDDDTIFFPENLVKTLSKYDDRLWYYIGSNSESYKQNKFFGFDMAYGGGGFAISASLAKVLAKVFDECIERYPHVYGSDGRVSSCVAELGIALTHEPGFHQVDMRKNAFGLLASHPLTPLVSLHHPDIIDPIFPNISTRAKSLEHLFEAVKVDSQRILQQTVCYHKRFSWTISLSWGYAVQVYQNPMLLTDVLRVQETFGHWSYTKGDVLSTLYTFNTRGSHREPCKRPTIFYLQDLSYGNGSTIISNYNKYYQNCSYDDASPRRLEMIKVVSNKLELDIKQLQSPRRHCCDVLNSSASDMIEIGIRECKDDELIYMH